MRLTRFCGPRLLLGRRLGFGRLRISAFGFGLCLLFALTVAVAGLGFCLVLVLPLALAFAGDVFRAVVVFNALHDGETGQADIKGYVDRFAVPLAALVILDDTTFQAEGSRRLLLGIAQAFSRQRLKSWPRMVFSCCSWSF